jgi:hypothetical protein
VAVEMMKYDETGSMFSLDAGVCTLETSKISELGLDQLIIVALNRWCDSQCFETVDHASPA